MIIIPTYNERKNIAALAGRIRAVLPETPILFVDDNSPDGTALEINSLQETDKNIHLITRPGKAGFASAYLDGFKFVLSKFDPEFIVIMDADLSHPPEKLPELTAIAKNGQVGVGSRYIEGGKIRNWKIRRRILSRMGNFYARLATKLPLRDITSGFMAIPAYKLKQLDLTGIESAGYAFLIELKVKLEEMESNFKEVPIVFEERKAGESKISFAIMNEGFAYPAAVFLRRQISRNLFAWLLFAGSFLVYAYAMPHSIYLGDSAEFVTAIATMGIPHPPGYPVYILLGKLFSLIPFGGLVFRVGLFSAFTASLSLVVFYFIVVRNLSGDKMRARLAAFIAGLILAFSAIFWSQAIMAKVYMLNLFWLLVLIELWIKYVDSGRQRYFLTASFLFGAGFGVHQMLMLFLPLFAFFHWTGKNRPATKSWLWASLLFCLGTLVYLYLPIRSSMHPSFDWGQTSQGFRNFFGHVFRAEYNDYGNSVPWSDKREFLFSFFHNLISQFGFLLLLIFPGLYLLIYSRRRFFWLTAGILIINSLGIIMLRAAHFGLDNEEYYSYYYLPAYTMAAIWISFGIFYLLGFFRGFKVGKTAVVALGFCLLLFPIWQLWRNFTPNNLRNFTFADDYTRLLLLGLPPQAVFLVAYEGTVTDDLNFSLLYEQKVKDLRPDVTILSKDEIFPPPDGKYLTLSDKTKHAQVRTALIEATLNQPEFNTRPIYTSFIADGLKDGWFSLSNGLAYKLLLNKPAVLISSDQSLQISSKDEEVLRSSYFGRDLLAQYYYAKAAVIAQNGNLEDSQDFYIKSIAVDNEPGGEDSIAYRVHRDNILKK